MGQWTIVIHGTGAHHNWATEKDDRDREKIVGRKNDYDADLMFAEFVDLLKAKGHTVTGSTFTHGGMEGAENVLRRNGKAAPSGPTVFELTCGSDSVNPRARYFRAHEHNDAIVRFAERIAQFDRDPDVRAAWVHLKRLPDSIYPEGHHIAGWTKTSDERPTLEGDLEAPGQ